MKENVSVEAGKCRTHSLDQTFRSVIRQANKSLPPGAQCRGGFLCTEGSHNGREPPATSRNFSPDAP